MAFGWYHGHDILGQAWRADRVAVIALIHNRMGQRWLRRSLRQHRLKDRTLMPLALRQHQSDAGAFVATAGVDFGGEAAPRAAQSLCGVATVLFHAPAAC